MGSVDIEVAPDHPMSLAVRLANTELRMGKDAAAGGNLGRVRVCARRAVGAFMQAIAPSVADDVGNNAMANLKWLQSAASLPDQQREAALRLAGGSRTEMQGGVISHDPLAD